MSWVPKRRAARGLFAAAFMWAAVVGGIGYVWIHSTQKLDATATILGHSTINGTRYAAVRFTTTAGAEVTTTARICHTQSYATGNLLAIKYDAAHPTRTWEKDMAPAMPPVGAVAVFALLPLLVAVLRTRGRRIAAGESVMSADVVMAGAEAEVAPWAEPVPVPFPAWEAIPPGPEWTTSAWER